MGEDNLYAGLAQDLVGEAERVVGEEAARWSPTDREKIAAAGEAVVKYGVRKIAQPDQAEVDRPIIDSIIARLRSIGTAESGATLESFFRGALKIAEVALPIILRAAIR